MSVASAQVGRYTLLLDRLYDVENHFWVRVLSATRVRVGMDPLGIEVSGTLAQLAFADVGTEVRRGEPFGNLEAAKFVGPLVAPISGRIVAHNVDALRDPGLVERDCFHDGWLVDLEPTDLAAERAVLLEGPAQIVPRFGQKIEEYRLKGVLAE